MGQLYKVVWLLCEQRIRDLRYYTAPPRASRTMDCSNVWNCHRPSCADHAFRRNSVATWSFV